MVNWQEVVYFIGARTGNLLRGIDNCLGALYKELKVPWTIVAVTSSGILKAKQKLGVTFNFDKQDVIDLTKFSKMTMCRASEANSEK